MIVEEATNSESNTSQTPTSRFPWMEGVKKDALSKETRIILQQAADILPIKAAVQVVAKASTAKKKIIPPALSPMTMLAQFSPYKQQIANGYDVSSQTVEGSSSCASENSKSPYPATQPEPVLPRDETLQKMQIILKKTLYGVSMEDFYTTCWSEPNFYKQWLENDEKHDIEVGAWEVKMDDDNRGFVCPWDHETYTQNVSRPTSTIAIRTPWDTIWASPLSMLPKRNIAVGPMEVEIDLLSP
jgi:hypothetical protein